MRIYDINPSDQTLIDPAGRECPLDPMTGEFKAPAGSMTEAPPTVGEHEAAMVVGDAWQVVADWRGQAYWLADGSRHEITELGIEPPSEALNEAPPEPLTDIADRKRRDIENGRKAAEQDGVMVNNVRYAGDPSNRQALREALDLAAETGLEAFPSWKDSDGEFRAELPVADIHEALMAIAARRSQLIAREGELNAQIDAALEAEDREGLEAITWPD